MTTSPAPVPAGAVVVGVDGSPLANEALAWAAAEAERSGAPLHVAHAFMHVASTGGFGAYDPGIPEDFADEVLREAVERVRTGHPELSVTAEVRHGPAAPQLIKAAKDARLIVLGAGGYGRVSGAILGSVSQQVAMHAACPVVVVRGRAERGEQPIVVGLDGSAEASTALGWALRYAADVGAPVRVVRAEYLEVPPGVPPAAWYGDMLEQLNQLTESVRREVETARDQFPGVDVELLVVRRHPVSALVKEAKGAQLVVVASRGLGGFTGLLLGSVSQGVLSRSPASVAILPAASRQEPEERDITR